MAISSETRLPEVEAFLAGGPVPSLVGGQMIGDAQSSVFCSVDPGTGKPLADICEMGAGDVDRAVTAAQRAFDASGWASLSPADRRAALGRLADEVERHKDVLAQLESLDGGKILAQAAGDVQNFLDSIRYFANAAMEVEPTSPLTAEGFDAYQARRPWGPCGFIFPWNFPILLVGWGIAPALAAGNTVVIKPAEDTPLSTTYLARLAQQAGIPDGVINVINGPGATTGAALAAHPDLRRMSFTGSPEVGRLIGEACGRNLVPVKLELGGKGAAVVFDDVDVARTAANLVGAVTFHAGQVCCDATRWLVHRPIYDRFVDEVTARMKAVKIGYQLDEATQMGPVVNEKQRRRVLDYLERGQQEGAQAVLEGGPAEVPGRDGFYVRPALLAGSLENVAAREEIFGPVAYLATFDEEDEAVAMVNQTDYGLANSVWTADAARADRVARRMVAGNSWINCHNVFPLGVPYGGVHQSGLGGGVNSIETLHDYWRKLSVVRPIE
ncbi:MAG: aldehyde dehydrogenase [Pirellulales bacterium]|nr:aldehyde dehydrogenase [Pirellulales bacterium]